MSSVYGNLVVDIPEALQFAAYVGEKAGFHVNKRPDATQTELEWREWWQKLPTQIATFSAGFRDFIRTKDKNQTGFEGIEPIFEEFGWSPPNFDNLVNQPELQALLRHYWPEFIQTADFTKIEMVKASEAILYKINLNALVQECTQLKGKTQPADFNLRIDLVRWPSNYKQQISPSHLVLGTYYLQANQFSETFNILKNQILQLV
jgi:hypothetical protein